MAKKRVDAFVEYYFSERFNGTKAATKAGYSARSAHVTASRLLKNPKVLAAIEKRMAELKMGADEVLMGLTEHARGSMADFLGVDKNGRATIDLKQATERGKLHLLKKIKITRKTGKITEFTTEIELYDAQAAFVQLGRHHKLFTEKVQVDWAGELRLAGLNPDELVETLADQFERHLLRDATGVDVGSLHESESAD